MLYEVYIEELCTRYEDVRLSAKYPEFKMLMQEYHDGILLFDLTDELVWSKAVKDSTGLSAYYQAHKTEYMWQERLQANIFSCVDEATAKSTRKLVKSRKKKSYSDEDILKMTNESSQLNLEIENGKFSKGDSEVIDKITWEVGISDNISLNDRMYFVEVVNLLPSQPKELDEIRGIMTSAFQTQLEEQWIAELRIKYPVTVNKEHLSLIK
jgi:peptidyl-prolyl cis-trans isomerase SurA